MVSSEKPPEENAMRWFRIRKANIDPTLREAYEQYGVVSLQLEYAVKQYGLNIAKLSRTAKG